MAEVHVYTNAAESIIDLTERIVNHGQEVSPRGQKTYELRNVTTVLTDPADCLCTGIGRNMNIKLGVMEALQLVGGFSDPAEMARIAPNTKDFWTGGTLSGAYGPRIRPQLHKAMQRLVNDESSRQAVVTVWDPLHDQQDHIKDIPCTVSFNWHVRNGKLHQTTHMRSNDVWWGWTYDVVMFTQLQFSVANALELSVGEYVHVVDSLHMYERNIEDSIKLKDTGEPRQRLYGIMPQYRKHHDPFDLSTTATEIFYNELDPHTLYSGTEIWMKEALHG